MFVCYLCYGKLILAFFFAVETDLDGLDENNNDQESVRVMLPTPSQIAGMMDEESILVDMRTGLYQLRRFESTDLLTPDRDHLMTYRAQSVQHGWHLNSAGLPQCATETALLTFQQDALLNAFEVGHPVPTSVILWTKGHDMPTRFSRLALALAPLLVRNLEDLDCPPARSLTEVKPAEMLTTVPKALAFARRMEDQHLA